jgi:transcriptional regulator with XRE-family HTH domain
MTRPERQPTAWIGRRIAHLRQVKGLSQGQLATAVGVTQPYISTIERGQKAVTRWDMVQRFAEALGVPLVELFGLPQPVRTPADLLSLSTVAGIRAALFYPDQPVRPRPLPELRAVAHQVMHARMACDYAVLGAGLPGLLTEARAAYEERGDERMGVIWVQAAVTASLTLKPCGWLDLATQLADLARRAAASVGRPASIAAAEFAAAQCVLASGAQRHSLLLTQDAIVAAEHADGNAAQAWRGMLHLHAALSAARAGAASLADGHFAEASALAATVEGDPWVMEFTLANVGVWRVGAALETDPGRAPELAARVDRSALRTRQRRCRLHMDAGRGYYAAGQPEQAVREFLRADAAAPDELRTRPPVLEIVGQMRRDAPRGGGSADLRRLVEVTGVAA